MKWLLRKRNRAQSIVEFALVLPLLLTLLFAVFDLGLLIYHHAMLNQAAREGLRLIAVGKDINEIAEKLQDMVEPLVGNVSQSLGVGLDDQGNPCTTLFFRPSSSEPVYVYITPVYNSTIAIGETVRIALLHRTSFSTPLSTLLGSVAQVQVENYTRLESSPP